MNDCPIETNHSLDIYVASLAGSSIMHAKYEYQNTLRRSLLDANI